MCWLRCQFAPTAFRNGAPDPGQARDRIHNALYTAFALAQTPYTAEGRHCTHIPRERIVHNFHRLYTTFSGLYTTFYGLYTGSLWGWFRCATGVHNMFYICTRRLPYEKSVYKRFYLVWLILLLMSSVCPQEASPPIHCKGAPAHSAFAHRAVVGNPPRGPPQGSWGRARGNQAVHVETGAPNLIDEPRTVCRHPARLVPKCTLVCQRFHHAQRAWRDVLHGPAVERAWRLESRRLLVIIQNPHR